MSAPPDSRPGTSARWRIVYWIIATVLLAMVCVVLTARTILISQVSDKANASVEQEVEEFRTLVREGRDPETAAPFTSTGRLLEVFLSRQIPAQDETIAGVIDGELVQIDTSSGPDQSRPQLRADSDLLVHIRQSQASSGVWTDDDGRVHWARVALNDQGGGEPDLLVVAVSTKPGIAAVNGQLQVLSLVAVGGLLASVLIGWLVAGQILAPVRDLRRVAATISDSDLTQRVPVQGDDEIAQLAGTFNNMLDRLQNAYRSQREFVDDAGHELRTPITVVRGQLELLDDASADQRRSSVALAINELDRMARIVNDLLTLATVDAGDFVRPEATDAAELLVSIEDKAQVMADRDVRLVSLAEGTVSLDPQRVTQAMLELFRNAVRHTTDGSVIELGTRFDGRGEGRVLRLWIRDHGAGIPADVLPTLFDRFTRGEGTGGESSDVSHRLDGVGLGLSIVRAISDAHHGWAWVESVEGEGSVFGLDLPAPTRLGVPGHDLDALWPVPGRPDPAPGTRPADPEPELDATQPILRRV